MFWGQNLKSGQTYSFDSDESLIGQCLNITNICLCDNIGESKYYLKFTNDGKTYQLCS